jgi:hypothetical protein
MLDPSWRPDESPLDLWVEHAANGGFYLGAIAYGRSIHHRENGSQPVTRHVYTHSSSGIHITVYSLAMFAALTAKRRVMPRLTALLSTALFLLATCNFVANAYGAKLAWIDYRNYPGGPSQFLQTNQGITSVDNLGNVAGVGVSWIADAILVSTTASSWPRCTHPNRRCIGAMLSGVITGWWSSVQS